jgi:lysozyme family protein
MPKVNLTNALAAEYIELFQTAEINPNRFDAVDAIVDRIVGGKSVYENVARNVGAPWYLVAAIHNMESNLSMARHLHNGDPLTARTTHVPAGRPATGNPPFTWEESAVDALKGEKIDQVPDWSLARILYELEGYNGWGYRLYHAHVKSPYLWSFSNHYTSGKYVADGTWSDTAASRQCGAAVIIKRLEQRGEIQPFDGRIPARVIPLRYAKKVIDRGEDLQRFLNTFPGITLRVDGWPGDSTSDAAKQVFGFYLAGDPRTKDD